MTTNELIYSVKELLKNHSDDSLVSNTHILHLFNAQRAMFLRQLYSKRSKAFDSSAIQSFCMPMEMVDKGLCGITTDCFVLRSTDRIPTVLSIRNRGTITYIGPSMVGAEAFDIVKPSEINSCMQDKYATTTAFIQDGYVYVSGVSPAVARIKCLKVEGIFEDPMELENCNTCEGCNTSKESHCFTLESTYPVPGHLVSLMTKEVLKSFILTHKLEDQRDVTNNSTPE